MIKEYKDYRPSVHEDSYITENVSIIGKVTLKRNANIWYGAVLRGDCNYITIGEDTNIQDNCVVHVTDDYPAIIGNSVTVGHSAIIHACTIGDNVLVGMGAIVLDGAEIGDNVIIAAGALVPPGKKIPSNTLVMGSPAKFARELTPEDITAIKDSADYYIRLAKDSV
ncbi:MAG: gamma carbonic anhydrase family protein [Clostridiales bacterium]|nr:gamma carbonic anhydrase family protein [Clostridiales bacterium]